MTKNHLNETAFIADCRAFNAGKMKVNPYVSNNTSYGISATRVTKILTTAQVFHPVYNPEPIEPSFDTTSDVGTLRTIPSKRIR